MLYSFIFIFQYFLGFYKSKEIDKILIKNKICLKLTEKKYNIKININYIFKKLYNFKISRDFNKYSL